VWQRRLLRRGCTPLSHRASKLEPMELALHLTTIVVALILSAVLGSPLVKLAFRWAKIPDGVELRNGAGGQSGAAGEPGGEADAAGKQENQAAAAAPTDKPDPPPELLRGGLMIGVLERLAVTGLLLGGYPFGIGVVVAVKGLGRFHELKGPYGALASEKFVIGTLTSYLWAGLMAVIGIAIRTLI